MYKIVGYNRMNKSCKKRAFHKIRKTRKTRKTKKIKNMEGGES